MKFGVSGKRRRGRRKRAVFRLSGRFLRVVCVSAVVSFSLVSAVLHLSPQSGTASVPIRMPDVQNLDVASLDYASPGSVFSRVADWASDTFTWLEPDRFSIQRFVYVPGDATASTGAVDRAVSGYTQTTFSQCPQFFPHKPPAVPSAPALRELCFSAFAILHSGQTRTPVFVAQRLNRRMLRQAPAVSRTDRFYAEARLPKSERAELSDYRNSGYSRGHMAPAGDMHNDDA